MARPGRHRTLPGRCRRERCRRPADPLRRGLPSPSRRPWRRCSWRHWPLHPRPPCWQRRCLPR
ncbi:MAG: hypothetical protein EXR79_00760 [Myxococcales bacterium]|nr:hypothetical protein [Myxococcales bacterium]